MEFQEVKDLMNQFNHSSLREFCWKTDESTLRFSKNDTIASVSSNDTIVQSDDTSTVSDPVIKKNETVNVVTQPEGEPVTSQLVGVAYLKSAPDNADFVKVGDTVKKGQTLLIIEAMKIMNEILSPKDGIVTEISVKSEDLVEFGQELMRIK